MKTFDATPVEPPLGEEEARDPTLRLEPRRLGPRRLALFLAMMLPLAVYLPFARRGFTSEDFLLLRFLDQNPPWGDFGALFFEPWLGISVVQFYRPVAVVLLAIEQSLFGSNPLPYNLIHLGVHLCTVVLVFRILELLLNNNTQDRRETTPLPPFVGAVTFALYPLHPNAVSWVGSYANLFGNFLFLLAMYLFLDRRERTGATPRRFFPALLVFLLALGCYESALILPAILLGYEILLRRSPWRQLITIAGVGGLIALLYLSLRKWVLGVAVGGYQSFSSDLVGRIDELLDSFGRSLLLLPWPSPGHSPASIRQGQVTLLVFGLTAALLIVILLKTRSSGTGAVLFALLLPLVTLAPFAYRAVWPAEGRYWYLASISVALLMAILVARVERLASPRRQVAAFALALLPLLYIPGLLRHLGWMSEAAETALDVRQAILDLPPTELDAESLFIANAPMFVTTADGINLAQIYHYGLSDSLAPPFAESSRSVFPILGPARAAALALQRIGPVLEWRDGSLERVEPAGRASTEALTLTGLDPDLELSYALSGALAATSMELVITTAGNTTRLPITPPHSPSASTLLPADFVESMAHLYPGQQRFVWIEARNPAGRLLAVAPALAF